MKYSTFIKKANKLGSGASVECCIDGVEIKDAKLWYGDSWGAIFKNKWFLCNNEKGGIIASEKLGYELSWLIDKDNMNTISYLRPKKENTYAGVKLNKEANKRVKEYLKVKPTIFHEGDEIEMIEDCSLDYPLKKGERAILKYGSSYFIKNTLFATMPLKDSCSHQYKWKLIKRKEEVDVDEFYGDSFIELDRKRMREDNIKMAKYIDSLKTTQQPKECIHEWRFMKTYVINCVEHSYFHCIHCLKIEYR